VTVTGPRFRIGPKIADRILSSPTMTPTSGDPRNSDLRPIVSIPFYVIRCCLEAGRGIRRHAFLPRRGQVRAAWSRPWPPAPGEPVPSVPPIAPLPATRTILEPPSDYRRG
jgi:hypothetical protein